MDKYKVKVTGFNTKYFIDRLLRTNINIYKSDISKKIAIIVIDSNNYERINKIKGNCKIEIIDYYGRVRVKHFLQKHYIFLLGIFFFLLTIVFLSNLILKVEVKHSSSKIRNIILNDLKLYGIKKYNFKVSYKRKEEIKKKILKKEEDHIEWLEINEKGTTYVINVEQRLKSKKKIDYKEQHIIAKKDAIIMNIYASNGEVVKKKYDYVKKGDIIISGIIHNKEKEMAKVRAEGTVYGEVWYKVIVNLPINYIKEEFTGKKHNVLVFDFLGIKLNLFNKYKTSMITKNTSLISNKILPINISYIKEKETNTKKYTYTKKNILKPALNIALKKINKSLKAEEKVISKQALKITQNNSRIEVEVFIKAYVDITDRLSIENIKLKEGDSEENAKSNN